MQQDAKPRLFQEHVQKRKLIERFARLTHKQASYSHQSVAFPSSIRSKPHHRAPNPKRPSIPTRLYPYHQTITPCLPSINHSINQKHVNPRMTGKKKRGYQDWSLCVLLLLSPPRRNRNGNKPTGTFPSSSLPTYPCLGAPPVISCHRDKAPGSKH